MVMVKRTLRKLKPRTRKFAQAVNGLETATRRLKALIPVLQELETWAEAAEALQTTAKRATSKTPPDP